MSAEISTYLLVFVRFNNSNTSRYTGAHIAEAVVDISAGAEAPKKAQKPSAK